MRPAPVIAAVVAAVAVIAAVAVVAVLLTAGGRADLGDPTDSADATDSADRADPGAAAVTGPRDPLGAWVLVEPTPAIDVPDGTRITLTVEDDGGRVLASGHAGCNTYDATVRIDGDAWTVVRLHRTAIGCEAAPMEAESTYLNWLLSIETWSRPEVDVLELTRGVTTLTFTRLPSVPPRG